MNICYLSAENPVVGHGGVDTVALVLTRGFEALGHKVFHLAWTRNEMSRDASNCEENLACAILPDPAHFGSAANLDFFEKFLSENKIDVVLYAWGIGKKYPFSCVTRHVGVPVAALFHNTPDFYRFRYGFFERIRRKFSQQSKYRHNFDACDALVLLTEGFRASLENFLRDDQRGRSREKIFAIGNPARFSRKSVDFSKKGKTLLMVGIGLRSKRPELLLGAWEKIQNRFPDWALKILGGGSDRDVLREIVREKQLQRVFLEGFQNPENYYREASIFCMTSAYEGFPMVLPESAAFGCVPVAFDSFAAVRDIISDGGNGVLVPAFDLDAYAEKLAQLMSDNVLRERLAQTALSQIPEKFSAQKIAQKWLDLFEKLKSNLSKK